MKSYGHFEALFGACFGGKKLLQINGNLCMLLSAINQRSRASMNVVCAVNIDLWTSLWWKCTRSQVRCSSCRKFWFEKMCFMFHRRVFRYVQVSESVVYHVLFVWCRAPIWKYQYSQQCICGGQNCHFVSLDLVSVLFVWCRAPIWKIAAVGDPQCGVMRSCPTNIR